MRKAKMFSVQCCTKPLKPVWVSDNKIAAHFPFSDHQVCSIQLHKKTDQNLKSRW